jgi:ribosome-binding protein aMBF1 (putative translation factor)
VKEANIMATRKLKKATTTRGHSKKKVKAFAKEKARPYLAARVRVELSPGDSVRVARELQEMTQAELAAASGIPQPTISSIESGRATLGAERAEKLARALKVHPAVLLWPNWDAASESKNMAG